MRIGIVISSYITTAGLERVAVEYARGLRDRGHEVVVFCQELQRGDRDEGISFERVGGARRNKALRAATFPNAATAAVSAAHLDNLITFGSSAFVPAVVRLPGCHRSWWEVATREWPVTTVDGMRRRLNPHHFVTLRNDKRVLGSGMPRAVLAAGGWAAADIQRFYPAVAEKVSILPDGVNLDEFSPDASAGKAYRDAWNVGEGPLLLTVATELRRKGLDTLFEAFRHVRAELPSAVLVVGGRTPAEDVRALAVHHRVQGGVRAIGFIEDMRAAYSVADVLVFPTRFDPWGLPIVEALACGTPVAASARAGASQVIQPGRTGTTIADPADPKLVALAAVAALSLRREPDVARASVEHLAWPKIVADLEAVLERTAR